MDTISVLSTLSIVVVFTIIQKLRMLSPRGGMLLPGPKRWPLIGNAPQLSMEYLHHTFTEWKSMYGTSMSRLCS